MTTLVDDKQWRDNCIAYCYIVECQWARLYSDQ